MTKGAASIERDLFPKWAAQGRLHAVSAHARFIDIGTPESLAAADAFFA
jgi:NDP-sugar pyrophosphorylase family protein